VADVAFPLPHHRPAEAFAREAREDRGLLHWFTTVDHKEIGILYVVSSYIFFLIGGIEALLMRLQLSVPRNNLLGPEAFNSAFTLHGATMLLLAVMPILLGFANYFVPLQIGARDMAFPRLNALSYWLFLFGGLLISFSLLVGTAPREGWFAHAPLTERPYTLSGSIDWWIVPIMVTSVGTLSTAVNLVVTVVKLRAPGMTALRLPVFTWMMVVTSLLIVVAFPSLTAAQIELLADRWLGTHFFQGAVGGDPVLYQHLFWFFGHPEVYILILPAFGIMSEVVPVFSRKPIFGYGFIVASGWLIAFLSSLVWAHHMFTVGMGMIPDAVFGATSLLIAVPTGVKLFSWLGTMWGGQLRFTTSMLYACGLILMFTIGGITGVHFAMVPLDWQTTDTYYVVGHFHYVLYFGSFFGVQAGLYYWFPKMTGRMLDERLGKWSFWIQIVGATLTFLPMHFLGLMGMPRRVYTYPAVPGWMEVNLLETFGAFLQAIALLILIYNVWRTLRHGRAAGDNPWDAATLEWATTSPPPAYNFAPGALPPIESARPLWDLKYGRLAPETGHGAVVARGGAAGEAAEVGERAAGFFERLTAPGLGMLTFVASDITLFGALILTFIEFRVRDTQGPGPSVLDVPVTGLFSLALFASSFTLIRGERLLERGNYGGFRRWLLATIVLGAVFLAGQLFEYWHLYGEGITIGRNVFTSAFYILTGTHGAHVLVGLILLSALAWTAWRGDYRGGAHHGAIQAISIYWHFVDIVWVFLWPMFYLLRA
jgi:cytochrome c oxidase subunit I